VNGPRASLERVEAWRIYFTNAHPIGAGPERLPVVSRLGGAMLISIAPVFLAAFLSWFKKARPLSILLLIVGYAAALVSGFVQPIGIAGVIVVALLAWLCNQTLNGVRGVALHIIFLVWAVLLFLHVLPGFQNPLIMGPVSFTPDAIPFKMYFNFDKAASKLCDRLWKICWPSAIRSSSDRPPWRAMERPVSNISEGARLLDPPWDSAS